MKKLILIILNLILAFSCLMPTWVVAHADEPTEEKAAFSLKYSLTNAEGQSVIEAEPDAIITVHFTMQRTDSTEDYTPGTFQNTIYYDLAFFQFVEGSIVCNDADSTVLKQANIEHGEVIQCQSMAGHTYAANFTFCTFQLKVIGTSGKGTIYNSETHVFDTAFAKAEVLAQDMQVIVSNDCVHTNKTKVEAKATNCQFPGWEAYYTCDHCDVLFDESGENLIAAIPYIPMAHPHGDTWTADEEGHWYVCTHCGEKLEYAAHSGGTATCTHKATCTTCGQAYGALDPQNHTGEAVIKDKKSPSFFTEGYTGDLRCSDCNGLLEAGATMAVIEIDNTTLLIWLLIIILILIVLGIAFNG